MLLRSFARSSSAWRPGASALSLRLERSVSSLPTIPTCPSPTCSCAETPEMPPGLPIDYSKALNGTMGSYAEQVLVCTGKNDWTSKIEDEDSGDNLAADIKELLGKGGSYSDPFHHVSVINSSLPSSIPQRREIQTTSAYLFPSFKYIPFLPRVSFDSVKALVRGFVLPTKLHPRHSGLSPIHRDRLLRNEDEGRYLPGVQDVKDVLVLICGHGGRDARCGVMGPVLKDEFEAKLSNSGYTVSRNPVDTADEQERGFIDGDGIKNVARVGLISHIGGHKYAGNVIVYIPPGTKTADAKESPLAGCGIWYGRIEPKHVEGIVKETILGGRVIEDHFRGGIRQGGELLQI